MEVCSRVLQRVISALQPRLLLGVIRSSLDPLYNALFLFHEDTIMRTYRKQLFIHYLIPLSLTFTFCLLSLGIVFAGPVTQYVSKREKSIIDVVLVQPSTGCIAGWVIDKKVVVHPEYKDTGIPEYIRPEHVKIPSDSITAKYLYNSCQIIY